MIHKTKFEIGKTYCRNGESTHYYCVGITRTGRGILEEEKGDIRIITPIDGASFSELRNREVSEFTGYIDVRLFQSLREALDYNSIKPSISEICRGTVSRIFRLEIKATEIFADELEEGDCE